MLEMHQSSISMTNREIYQNQSWQLGQYLRIPSTPPLAVELQIGKGHTMLQKLETKQCNQVFSQHAFKKRGGGRENNKSTPR